MLPAEIQPGPGGQVGAYGRTPLPHTAQEALASQIGPVAASQQAHGLIYGVLVKQATLLAFVDNFGLLGFLCLLFIPSVFLFKKAKMHGGPVAAH